MVKPNMSKKEDIEDIVNSAVEKTTKKIFDATVGTEGKKLSDVLKDIKNKTIEDTGKKEDVHKHEDYDIDCPSCKTGHVHKLKEKDGVLKCTGDGCGQEYYLASTTPEFQCINCGTPVNKPLSKELEDKYSCPTCGKDHFKEFDKRKIKKIKT